MEVDDVRLKNLKPFTGADDPRRVTGAYRKGKPNYKTRLKRFLELVEKFKNPITGELEEFTIEEELHLIQIANARKGNIKAYNSIMDRYYGKPKQVIDHNIDIENFDNENIIDLIAKIINNATEGNNNKTITEGQSELIAEGSQELK